MLPFDLALSLLPLAHVYERTIDYGYIFRGVSIAYVEHMDTVAQALLEVRPTIMAAVPRFYEKTYANIIERGHRETGLKKADIRCRHSRSGGGRALAGAWPRCLLRSETALAHRKSLGLFADSRGRGGQDSNFQFGRRPARSRTGGILLERRSAGVSGLRPHGNFSGCHLQFAEGEQGRHGRPPDSRRAGAHRG